MIQYSRSRKNSRKPSRKASRKQSRKGSRKASRKQSRKGSRKPSRKQSRKVSRKPYRKAKMGMGGPSQQGPVEQVPVQQVQAQPAPLGLFLSHRPNCDVVERYADWERSGGTLLGVRTIGCGINCLTFIGIFTRVQGEALVRNIITNQIQGTSFTEMMNYVRAVNLSRIMFSPTIYDQHMQFFSINTSDNLKNFIITIRRMLAPNSCTVAKLMRHAVDTNNTVNCGKQNLTAGHSVILSVQQTSQYNNSLLIIDPQLMTLRTIEDEGTHFNKLRTVWAGQCYTHVALMFSFLNTPINAVPMDIDYDEHPVPMDID